MGSAPTTAGWPGPAGALLRAAEVGAVYRRLVGARIRSEWQYRTSFLLFLASQFLVAFLDFLAILVIFHQVPALGGWTVAQVAFLYGASGVAFNVADLFISQVEEVAKRIRQGTFDLLLVRPLGTLVQLSADEFALRRVGKILQAAGVLAIAITQLDVTWTAGRMVMLPVMILSGLAIFAAVWVISASLSFWTVETREAGNAFTYGGNFLTQYPVHLYAPWLRRLLAFVVPLAFVSYFPTLYILDLPDPLGLPDAVRFLSPLVAAAAALVAGAVWRSGIRHYHSTGS